MIDLHTLNNSLGNVWLPFGQHSHTSSPALESSIHFIILPIMIGWVVLFGMFIWAAHVALKEGMAGLKGVPQMPCDRCLYFTNNIYLNCAVHPCRALTDDAIGCPDFETAHLHLRKPDIIASQLILGK